MKLIFRYYSVRNNKFIDFDKIVEDKWFYLSSIFYSIDTRIGEQKMRKQMFK